MKFESLITFVSLILFVYSAPLLQSNPDPECLDDEMPRLTIGILGLTYGSQTYWRPRDRISKILEQIEKKISGDSVKLPRETGSESDQIRNYLNDNEFMYYQHLDSTVDQQNPDYETFLDILKEHDVNFQKKYEYCKNDGSNEHLRTNQGNDYLYYSTSYAKMLFGWNQFDEVIPDSTSEEEFWTSRNKYVRTVPIDTSLAKTDPALLEKVIRKLDGVIFTGGNGIFYTGIEDGQFDPNSEFAGLDNNALMQKYLEMIKNNNPDHEKLLRKKSTYFTGLTEVLKIVKNINRETEIPRKIPVFAICLGYEGLLLNSGEWDLRLSFVSDKYYYHDTFENSDEGRILNETSMQSFRSFVQNYYKNPKYFPNDYERNAYFYHTKMMSKSKFNNDANLPKDFNIVTVSYYDDKGRGNKSFNDLSDWTGLQKKKTAVYPNNSKELEEKIQEGHMLYFESTENNRSDFRLQQADDIALIYKIIDLVKAKLQENIAQDLRDNYNKFVEEAQKHVDDLLKTSNTSVNLQKWINTDYKDTNNQFISIIEGTDDPIYGIQFHVEKTMYNFHNNKYLKNSKTTRMKDQLIMKFFLKKVLEEKIKYFNNLKQKKPTNTCLDKPLEVFNQLSNENFTECKLVPTYNGCENDDFNTKFKFEWLARNITKLDNAGNEEVERYSVDTHYNNNLSEQILRDYDEFYREVYEKDKAPGPRERFIIRNLGSESEVLIFKKEGALDKVYEQDLVKCH